MGVVKNLYLSSTWYRGSHQLGMWVVGVMRLKLEQCEMPQ